MGQNLSEGYAKGFTTAGVASSIPCMNSVFNEVGNNINQHRGHGSAAEYANTAFDRFTGDFRAKHMGGDNSLNGADRSTHRLFQTETLIQCKYLKSPSATIKDAFLNHDCPLDMKIEVPRDKYNSCVKNLLERINRGELEHKEIKRGDNAKKYLRRGTFTYIQSKNIAVAGRLEGIAVDAMQGVVCSAGAGSITALMTFATCKWNGY